MNKREIEEAIYTEILMCVKKNGGMPFDKALPIIQKEAWILADKYNTDGSNVMNILFTYMNKEKK